MGFMQSAIDTEKILVDADTQAMLKAINFGDLQNVELAHNDYKPRRQFKQE